MTGRILMVDDEPRVLDGLRRTLNGRFRVTVADSGAAGLAAQQQALDDGEPFPVIVSDMMMPGMNGSAFLVRARQADPDVVPLILSGQADLDSTITAVNEAGLFGFLTKPCPTDVLVATLERAQAQHALVLAERELLERTVRGAVDMLTDAMAAAAPLAYVRTVRIKDLVAAVAPALDLQRSWELLLAVRLSQVGCLALPEEMLARAYGGEELTEEEQTLYAGTAAAGAAMVGRIPRLERVASWIAALPLIPEASPPDDAEPAQVLLCAAAAFVAAFDAVRDSAAAAGALARTGLYPEPVVRAITAKRDVVLASAGVPRTVSAFELTEGMTLQEDVTTVTGMTLVCRGTHVTHSLADRLHNFSRTVGLVQPIHVIDHRRTARRD